MPCTLKDFEPFFKFISNDAVLIPNDKIIASKIVFWDDSFMEGNELFVNGAKIIKGDSGKRKYYPCGTILFRGKKTINGNILILPGRTINRSITIPFIAIADKIYLTNGNNDGIGGNSTVLAAIGIFTLTDTGKSVNAVALLDDIAYGLKHPITAKDVNGKYITLRNNSLETDSLSLTFDTSLLETNGTEFVSLNGTGSGTAYGVPVEGPIIITFTNELVVTLEYSIELGGQNLPPGATITGSGEYLYGSGAEVLGFSSDTGLTISFTDPKFIIASSDNGKLHYQDIIINDGATVEINGDVTTITAGGTVEVGGQELPIGTVITNDNGTISYAPPSGSNVWGITSAGTITVTYSNGVYTMSSTDTLVYNEAIISGEINITFPNDNMTIKPIPSAIVKVGSEQLDSPVVITNNGTTNVYSFPNKAAFGVTSDGELSMTYQHDNVNDIDLFSTTSTSGDMEYLGIALSGMNIIGFSAGAQYVTTTEDYEVGGHSMSAGGSIMDNGGVNNYIYTNGVEVLGFTSAGTITITYSGSDTFNVESDDTLTYRTDTIIDENVVTAIATATAIINVNNDADVTPSSGITVAGHSMPSDVTIKYTSVDDKVSYYYPNGANVFKVNSITSVTITYNGMDTFTYSSSALTCNNIPLITPYAVTFTSPSVQEVKYTDSFLLGGQSMPSGTTIVYDAANDSYSYACPPNVGILGFTSVANNGFIIITYDNPKFKFSSSDGKLIYKSDTTINGGAVLYSNQNSITPLPLNVTTMEVGGHILPAKGTIIDDGTIIRYNYPYNSNVFDVSNNELVNITYSDNIFTYTTNGTLVYNGVALSSPYMVMFDGTTQIVFTTTGTTLGGQSIPSGGFVADKPYIRACLPNTNIWRITSDGIITLTYNNIDTFTMKSTTNKFTYTNSDGEFDIETSLLTIPVTSDPISYLSETIDKFSYKNLYYIGNAQIKIGVNGNTVTISEVRGAINFGDLYTSSSGGYYSEYTIPYSEFIAPSIITSGYLSNSTYSFNLRLQFGRLDTSIDNGVPNLKITSGKFWIMYSANKSDISSNSSLDYTLQYDSNANGPYLYFTDMTTNLNITGNGYINNATSLEIENVSYGSSLVEGDSLTIIGESSLLNDYNSNDALTVTATEPLTYIFGDGSNVYVSMSHNKISYNSAKILNPSATTTYNKNNDTPVTMPFVYLFPFSAIG